MVHRFQVLQEKHEGVMERLESVEKAPGKTLDENGTCVWLWVTNNNMNIIQLPGFG